MGVRVLACVVLLSLCVLSGCQHTWFGEPQPQGHIGLVQSGDAQRLWVLHRQTEERTVTIGGRGRNNSSYLRKDTYYHFEVQAFDPVRMRPVWTRRVVTYGDPDLQPLQRKPSRVVGSAVEGRLLGQDGGLVWLLVDEHPYALDADTGARRHDRASIIRANPALAGLLPSEARFWRFDRGLVATLADGLTVRLAGHDFTIEDYVPPSTEKPPERKPNGMPKIVPMRPPVPMVRHRPRGEREWLALYTDKEAATASEDRFGTYAEFPHAVVDEGGLARRTFRRVRLGAAKHFDETIVRITAIDPVPESPVLLRGRFVRDPSTDAAMDPGNGDLLVWHRTRVDDAGRLVLSRLGANLEPRWQAELPISDGGTDLPVLTWRIGQHLVVHGLLASEQLEVRSRVPHLASVSLEDGTVNAWNIAAGAPPGEPARWPSDG